MQRREVLKLAFGSLLVALAPRTIKAGLTANSAPQSMHLTVSNATDLTIVLRLSDPGEPANRLPAQRTLYPGYGLQDNLPYGCLAEFLTDESATAKAKLRYDFVAGIHSELTRTIEFSHDSNTPRDILISERIGVNQHGYGQL